MGVEKHQMTASAHNNDATIRCLNNSNPVDLYRPPALRNHSIDETIIPSNNVAIAADVTTTDMIELTNLALGEPNVVTNENEPNAANANEQHSYRRQNGLNDVNAITSATTETTIMTSVNNTEKLMAATQQQQQQRNQTTTATTRRERRPDRAVYVPRAVRRSQTTPPAVATIAVVSSPATTTTATAAAAFTNNQQQSPIVSVMDQTALVANATSDKADVCSSSIVTSSSTTFNVKAKKTKTSSNNGSSSSSSSSGGSNSGNKERKERHKKSINSDASEVKEIPNSTDLQQQQVSSTKDSKLHESTRTFPSTITTSTTTTNQNDISNCDNDSDNTFPQEITPFPSLQLFSASNTAELNNSEIVDQHQLNNTNNIIMGRKNGGNKSSSSTKQTTAPVNALRIEDVASNASNKRDNDDEQELQRASKEINRSNRRIMKQSFVSDVLEIPEKIDDELTVNSHSNRKLVECSEATSPQPPIAAGNSGTYEEEEDDWESMFDETGECLDPKIMEELTASVGKVKIELPKMDYTAYLSKQAILNNEEFPHVLEVSNFPTEFKTPDLLMVFSQYKESGFDIKWVDDTHALAVFSSANVAAEVLTMGHPFVVLKPLALATIESRLKAKKCATSLQPYKPRPETCAALARRLVTGALGVRLKTAAAEREIEKRVLREAKERKLLAAKQRDEAWES